MDLCVTNENESKKQILKSSAIIGSASIINILIGLLRIKVVAVLLGPAGVGLVGILNNLMSAASSVSSFGVGNVGTRQIAEAVGRNDQHGIDAARRALFWGTMLLAVIGGGIFWLLRHQLAQWVLDDSSMASSVGWLAVGVALSVAGSAQGALLAGMRRIGDIARAQILSAVFYTGLAIAAIIWLGEKGLLLYILVTPLVSFVVSHIFVARLPRIQSPHTPIKTLLSQWQIMIRLGGAFMLAGLAAILGQLAVRTLVQRELGADALGYFHAAFTISMTYLGFVLGAMGADYYPRLTAAIHNNESANKLVNEQTEVALILAGPVMLAMLTLAPFIIHLLYSVEFSPAASILRWQILGDILKIVSWPLGFIIVASGDGRTFLLTESTSILVFVGATWLLLPLLGVEATGISFLLMYVLYLPMVYLLARHRTNFRWNKTVIRDLSLLGSAAVLISALSTWYENLGIAVGLLFTIGFCFISLLRLARMVELGGALGKLAAVSRHFLFKLGVMNE